MFYFNKLKADDNYLIVLFCFHIVPILVSIYTLNNKLVSHLSFQNFTSRKTVVSQNIFHSSLFSLSSSQSCLKVLFISFPHTILTILFSYIFKEKSSKAKLKQKMKKNKNQNQNRGKNRNKKRNNHKNNNTINNGKQQQTIDVLSSIISNPNHTIKEYVRDINISNFTRMPMHISYKYVSYLFLFHS